VLVRRTGSKAILEPLLAEARVPANSDYFPFLDLNAGEARFREDVSTLFQTWSIVPIPLLEMLGVADVRYERVTPVESFQRTQLTGSTRVDLALLAPGVAAPALDNAGALDSTLTSLLRVLRASCGLGFERNWAEAVHALARETLPYADPHTGAALLDAAIPAACRDRLSADMRVLVDLHASVAARDGHKMAEAAEKVLDGSASQDLKYYALTAGMLGRLAIHEPERAIQLYESHRDVAGDVGSSPELRLMLALAKSRHAAVTTTQAPHALL
jgi:hypothetical protein